MNDQPTMQDLLEAINESSSQVEERLVDLKKDIIQEMGKQKHEIMDHVDRRVADLEGDMAAMLRKEDSKVNHTLDILEHHKVAPVVEIERVRRIHLFPAAPEVS